MQAFLFQMLIMPCLWMQIYSIPPELLPRMLDVLESGYDCCGARRISRSGELKFRSFLSNLFYKIINKVTSMDLVPGGADFRMIKHSVVNAMLSLQESERFTKGLLSWVGFTTKWIPCENVERTLGKTKWSFKSLFNYALRGLLGLWTKTMLVLGLLIFVILVYAFRKNLKDKSKCAMLVFLLAMFPLSAGLIYLMSFNNVHFLMLFTFALCVNDKCVIKDSCRKILSIAATLTMFLTGGYIQGRYGFKYGICEA